MTFPTLPIQEVIDIWLSNIGVYDTIDRLQNLRVHVQKPKNPNHIGIKTSAEMLAMVKKMEAYETAFAEYEIVENSCKIHNQKVDALIHDFICDVSGLNRIPEQYRNKVYSKAWSDGHSDGYYSVYQHLVELVDIFE